MDYESFSARNTDSPYQAQAWEFTLEEKVLSVRFIHNDGMWGNEHLRFITLDDERGGHLIGIHQVKPDLYTPVHVLPHGNGDIIFRTTAGSGILITYTNPNNRETIQTTPLLPNSSPMKLEGTVIIYCLFADHKGLEVAYITTPAHMPHEEEMLSPGFPGQPAEYWNRLAKEVEKRVRKPSG